MTPSPERPAAGDRCAPATVHVVDDDAGVRALFHELGTAEGFQVATYAAAAPFLAAFADEQPGCLVLDLNLPDRPGLDVLRELLRRGSGVPVVCMSGCARAAEAVRAVQLGGLDFVEKPCSVAVLAAAIRRALAADRERRRLRAVRAGLLARFAALTPREREVLRCVVEGLPNKVVAARLRLSPKTIEVHRAHVMRKTGAASLADLVRMAVAAGFVAAYA